jgi:hypothetical protein
VGCASGLYFLGAESEECWDDTPLVGVFELELGSDVRSVSIIGGLGLLEGREFRDIVEGDRAGGNEEREVRRFALFEMKLSLYSTVSVVPAVPLVVERCMALRAAFVD